MSHDLHIGAWQVVAASRRGRLHAHRGDYREDAVAVCALANGWCAAVADGAGSAPYSRIGAAMATTTFCDTFAAATGPLEARAAASARAAHAALCSFASAADIARRDLRTTLLAVAVVDGQIASLQVGDGGLVLVHRDDRVTLPHGGDSGEFSGEVTHFLPDDGSEARLLESLDVRALADIRAILLASDGIEDPFYPLARHTASILSTLERPVTDAAAAEIQQTTGVSFAWRGDVMSSDNAGEALSEWLTFEKRGENDDRTLFVARLRHDA